MCVQISSHPRWWLFYFQKHATITVSSHRPTARKGAGRHDWSFTSLAGRGLITPAALQVASAVGSLILPHLAPLPWQCRWHHETMRFSSGGKGQPCRPDQRQHFPGRTARGGFFRQDITRRVGGRAGGFFQPTMEASMPAIRIPNRGSHVTQIDAYLLASDLRTELDNGLRLTREKQRRLRHLLLVLAGKGGMK